jgi:hypothetical protein
MVIDENPLVAADQSVYAVTWVLAELEPPIGRYTETIMWPWREAVWEAGYRHVSCEDEKTLTVEMRIAADDVMSAIDVSRWCVFRCFESDGLRLPGTVTMRASRYQGQVTQADEWPS